MLLIPGLPWTSFLAAIGVFSPPISFPLSASPAPDLPCGLPVDTDCGDAPPRATRFAFSGDAFAFSGEDTSPGFLSYLLPVWPCLPSDFTRTLLPETPVPLLEALVPKLLSVDDVLVSRFLEEPSSAGNEERLFLDSLVASLAPEFDVRSETSDILLFRSFRSASFFSSGLLLASDERVGARSRLEVKDPSFLLLPTLSLDLGDLLSNSP